MKNFSEKFNFIFLCAGQQTRFKCDQRKEFMYLPNGQMVLNHNISKVLPYAHSINIIQHPLFFHQEYILLFDNVKQYFIEKSTGNPIKDLIFVNDKYNIVSTKYKNVLIWGDVILSKNIYEIFNHRYMKKDLDFVVPVKYEKTPYCIFDINYAFLITGAKLNTESNDGFHDQSIFIFNSDAGLDFLYKNQDLQLQSFIEVFNYNFYCYPTALILNPKNIYSLSYNTIDEYWKAYNEVLSASDNF